MRPSAYAAIAVLLLAVLALGALGVAPGGAALAGRWAVLLWIAALAMAAFSIALALVALSRVRRVSGELSSFSRSIESALARLSAENQGQAAASAQTEASLRGEIEALARRLEEREDVTPRIPDNIVPHPSSRKAQDKPEDHASHDDALENALSEAVASGELELSLQPIVSVSTNAAVGFETFVHLGFATGRTVHLRRLAATTRIDRAAFERLLVVRATETARRRLGQEGRQMPLHCAVSEALFDDATESAAVTDLLALYPALARTIVLSLPTSVLLDSSPLRKEALERMLATKVAFAAEGWDDAASAIVGLRSASVGYLKVGANRLLDRDKARRKTASGLDIVNAAVASGVKVIATGVETDEDAMHLLDLGVDLMLGSRFSAPKRLRADEPSKGRVA